MVYGTVVAYGVPVPGKPGSHFGGSTAVAPLIGQKAYIALTAFVLNVAVVVALTLLFRALKVPAGRDATVDHDYVADAGEADVRDLPEVIDMTEPAPSGAPSERPTSRGR
jgi:SSS family solute:Na+ symporter